MGIDLSALKKSMTSSKGSSGTDYSNYDSSKAKKNNRNSNFGNVGNKGGNSNKYVGAPYNFVGFSDKTIEVEGQISHNDTSSDLYSGEIVYEITAKTPINVGTGADKNTKVDGFYKNANGKYAIPGSTVRGLIRNNVQVLSLSSMNEDIDDYTMMYREVAAGADMDLYNKTLGNDQIQYQGHSLSILKNVKGGYIKNDNGKYYIYPTVLKDDKISSEFKEMNYYVLTERYVIDSYVDWKNNGKRGVFPYDFLIKNPNYMEHTTYSKFKKSEDRAGNTHYKNDQNNSYGPGFKKISYELKDLRKVIAVGAEGEFSNQGYLMVTGKMQEKKAMYIIPAADMDDNKRIQIPDDDIKSFKIDYEKRKTGLKQKQFFNLPEKGEMKPVFYIFLNDRLYFGFTPRLRLFNEYKVKDGLNNAHSKVIFDYARSLFGYADRSDSYKTRISFNDAEVKVSKNTERKTYLLAGPKPSSYMDYLEQGTTGKTTYNSEGFRLRGIKQYWLHKNVVPYHGKTNEKMDTVFDVLPEGTVFTGKVRYYNLRKEELGLLLWSLKLNPESEMNIGKAKAWGYGRVKLELKRAVKVDAVKSYSLDTFNALPVTENLDVEGLIGDYKDFMNKKLSSKPLMERKEIKDFFTMKDSTRIPDNSATRYMTLGNKREGIEDEYIKREVLPDIKTVVNKKK